MKVEEYLKNNSSRNRLLFVLGTNSGLRISDILSLNVSDVRHKTHIVINEQKTGKFKALVIRDIDEMGVSKKYTNDSFEYAEEFLNDRPDTNYAAKKFGLIKMFSAKSDEPLSPATIRTGRIGWRMTPMPYDNEPAEVWKNYLDYTKDHYGSEYITQVIKYAKKLFKKRGGQDLKELTPHFKFQLPYAAAEFKDPLKKWQKAG